MNYILGISCGFHDSAACLLKDGKVVSACEEERFTGIKHDFSFPHNTINWIFESNSITKEDINYICFYENPTEKLDRIKTSTQKRPKNWYDSFFKKGNNDILDRNKKAYDILLKDIDSIKGKKTKVSFTDHHTSHLAYSYFTSPFKNSAILSVDGVGEWKTTSLAVGKDNKIKELESVGFPDSLGMFYSTMTAFLGFKPNEGEYKVMGLAPYGNPKKYNIKFENIIKESNKGLYELNMDYFTYEYSDTHMFNEKLGEQLGITNRLPEEPLTQDYKDLAASVQFQYEKYFFKLLDKLYKITESPNLCLSGGCAYNGTANGKIKEKTKFQNIWIPPAPSDAGSCVGTSLSKFYSNKNQERVSNVNPFLGPYYTKEDILKSLNDYSKDVYYEWKPREQMIPFIAEQITENNIIGLFQDRIEFGARALGNRSILANPCDPQMKSRLNRVIKKREGFRPFAPICTFDSLTTYFNYDSEIPYMNQVVKVKERFKDKLPSITHVDGSARVQTVTHNSNRYISLLLKELDKVNKFPIVINTSFNLKDQTMVLTPEDAIKTFLNCEMDILILGSYVVKKKIL